MNPNESAFPQYAVLNSGGNVESSSAYTGESGLTVRAYIAAKALQGILSNPNVNMLGLNELGKSELSVKMADALIAELNKTP